MIKLGFLILLTGFWAWLFEYLANIQQCPWFDKVVTVLIPLWNNFVNAPAAFMMTVGAVIMLLGLLRHVCGSE